MRIMYANKQVNPSRVRLEAFVRKASMEISPQSLILDAGSGEGQYRHLFTDTIYHATDMQKVKKTYSPVTFICDLAAIPVSGECYHHVICTQVLEHVPEPEQVLCEFYRVLKTEGTLWLSAPFFFEEHEQPYDYYRYTRFGLKYLVEKAGFSITRLDWLEGYYGTLAYQMNVARQALGNNPTKKNISLIKRSIIQFIIRPLFIILMGFFTGLELKTKNNSIAHGKNIIIIARKIIK